MNGSDGKKQYNATSRQADAQRLEDGGMTDKEFALRLMMLLSALESWSFSANVSLPDYLSDELCELQDGLRKVVLQ